jgi:hypothetical protein
MRLWNVPSLVGMALIVCGLVALAVHSERPIRFHDFVGAIRLFGGDVDLRWPGYAAMMVGVVFLLIGALANQKIKADARPILRETSRQP